MGDSLVAGWIGIQESTGAISAEEAAFQRDQLKQVNQQAQDDISKRAQEELDAQLKRKEGALAMTQAAREAELAKIQATRDGEIGFLEETQNARWAGFHADAAAAQVARDEAGGLAQNLAGASEGVKDTAEGFGSIVKQAASLATLSESRFLSGRAELEAAGMSAQMNEQRKQTTVLNDIKKILAKAGGVIPGNALPIF
jgi:hypothetical protein